MYKPTTPSLSIIGLNIQRQCNGWDCGVYAIAFATDLVNGKDPCLSRYLQEEMRRHLISCLEEGNMSPFPTEKKEDYYPITEFCIRKLKNNTVFAETLMTQISP